MKPKIILASTSPRRKQLLEQIGLDFKTMPSDYEEDMNMNLSPKELVKTLAYGKAKDVADKINEGIVIGVDTFLVKNKRIIGKPHTKEKAHEMLNSQSGKTIKVYSGLALIDAKTGKKITDYDVSRFTFKKLSDKEIKNYIETEEPIDKAGAIAIQGLGGIFIKKIKGGYSNIIGLPLPLLSNHLQEFGIFISESWNKQ